MGMHDLPVDDEAHLLFSCPATTVVLRRCWISCAVVMFMVALFVHKCIKILDEVESDGG
jgi:hypothetical protein